MSDDVAVRLRSVVDGDMADLDEVLATPHGLLERAAAGASLTVGPEALTRIVDALLNGSITPERAQQWASFIRHGSAPQAERSPIRPIDIDYDSECDQLVADVLGRLDEIGDLIDGEVTPDELLSMRERLRLRDQ